jgi:ribosome-associated toxin RatA of RatAB toxin-antitoxin module
MAEISRSALVMHSAQAMYDLVNDVASYPQFMDGCAGVEIFEHNDHSMLARLDLKKAGVQISFVTRNSLDAPHQIEMQLQDGPFKMFKGTMVIQAASR